MVHNVIAIAPSAASGNRYRARLMTMVPSHPGGRSVRDSRAKKLLDPSLLRIKMSRFRIVFLFVAFCAASLNAQQSPQSPYPDGSQNPDSGLQAPGAVDCSDPSQFSDPLCSSQNQRSNQTQSPQLRSSQSDRFGNQTPGSNGNYSDTEQLNRQQSQRGQIQERRPQAPLTEFQKFVASTTGQILPVYGANLFERVPSTFAPVDMAPVPPDFVIGPGDELRIRVWGQLSFQANVRVDRSGDIYLPQVGPIHVASIPFSELDGHLRSAIGRVFHNFDLTVDLGQIRSIQIYLAGAARTPGVYTVSSLSTLVDALFAGGGPNMQGSLRNIELRRGNQTVTHYDLYDLLVRGHNSTDAKLLPGDVIYIPPVGPQIAVTGSVKSPGIYELLPGETLSAALGNAGGVSAVASAARVSVERIEAHNERRAMEIAYDKTGLETPLVDGDIVRIFSIVPRYDKTVVLRGNLANPGRFAWHPGMRLSDLIPDKDSLITRDYWWKRTQLGLPAPEFEPTAGFQNLRQPYDGNVVTLKPPPQEDLNSQNGMRESPQDRWFSPQDRSGYLDDRPVSPDDRTGSSQGRSTLTQQRATSSSLASQQSGSSSRESRNAQHTSVRLLAPDIDWDYATIERIDPETLKTTLVPFDLGNLVLKHDATQDIELRSGDIVSIFSEADIHVPLAEQTKLVTLDGEFVHSGVYSVKPDETLKELVERAGGISPKAYLYGSEFTRESVRIAQQARIDEYTQTLEMRMQRSNLALAASSTSTPQDVASGTAAQNSERDLVASLRQIRATGRIVLTLKPESAGTISLPDMTMENGDRFVIPPVPAIVNVIGAVYNQNSFLYVKGRRVGAYLLQAGGPNKDSDRKHAFIVRANGDVVSRNVGKTLWGSNEFLNLKLNPGDTIVVPEKTFRPGALRGVLDWSQVFSQLALGAAAIRVL
jgi:protein involved in polysaccharide export with SLBB domain